MAILSSSLTSHYSIFELKQRNSPLPCLHLATRYLLLLILSVMAASQLVFDLASNHQELNQGNSSLILSPEQLETLRDEGLVRVPGLIPRMLVDRAREVIDRHLHLFSDENEDEDGSLGEVRASDLPLKLCWI